MAEVEKTPEELAAEKLAAEQAAAKKAQAAADKKAAKEQEKKDKAEQRAKDAEAKKEAKAKAEADKKQQRLDSKQELNGVVRPLTGATLKIWEIADAISAATKAPAERATVMEQGKAAGLQEGTINTQYGRWRKYHGLVTAREAKPAAPAAPEAGEGNAEAGAGEAPAE